MCGCDGHAVRITRWPGERPEDIEYGVSLWSCACARGATIRDRIRGAWHVLIGKADMPAVYEDVYLTQAQADEMARLLTTAAYADCDGPCDLCDSLPAVRWLDPLPDEVANVKMGCIYLTDEEFLASFEDK